MPDFLSKFRGTEGKPFLLKNADILFIGSLFGIVGLLILPIPTSMMDLLLTMNIGMALLILVIVVYVKNPPEFSVFPTILLSVTLFRLGLNIATTRLILLEGYAGKVIDSFGTFVVKGNYVVGAVVFLILVIINFVVITKGAGRIAEVSARFTLDAMPGKQMAIDAELNAGLIDEKTARKRREGITKEADFYGAMDGASKFVRGDAVAGILITLVNIVGGISIGVFQKGYTLIDSLQKYTLLSIGDGLVSQVPALVISVAAGILVTRTAGTTNLGTFVGKQLTLYPRALTVVGSMLIIFGLLPGLPLVPFMFIGGCVLGIGYTLKRAGVGKDALEEIDEDEETKALPEEEVSATEQEHQSLGDKIQEDPITIELGLGLINFADKEHGGDLSERILGIRKTLAQEMGILLSPVCIRDNLEIDTNAYRILIWGRRVGQGTLMNNRWMAIGDNEIVRLKGVPSREPAFGLEAVWINDDEKRKAEMNGFTVVDAMSVLVTHVAEILRNHAYQLLNREDTQRLLDTLKETHPTIVQEMNPEVVSVGLIQRILQNLLAERIPIKNLATILETVSDFVAFTKNPDELSEQVRRRIGPYFMSLFENEQGQIQGITLDPRLEQALLSRVKKSQFEVGLMMDPGLTEHILKHLEAKIEEMTVSGLTPNLIVTTEIRLPFKRFFDPSFPRLNVLAYQELPPEMEVTSCGVIQAPSGAPESVPAGQEGPQNQTIPTAQAV